MNKKILNLALYLKSSGYIEESRLLKIAANVPAPSTVTVSPGLLSKLKPTGFIGNTIIYLVSGEIVDRLMDETKEPWEYNVSLSSQYDIEWFRGYAGIGNTFDKAGKVLKQSVLDIFDEETQTTTIPVGSAFKAYGSQFSKEEVFVPGGVIVLIKIAGEEEEIVGVFQGNSSNGKMTVNINDGAIKAAFDKFVGGDKELDGLAESSSLADIAKLQLSKSTADKDLAQNLLSSTIFAGTTYAQSVAAANAAAAAASAGTTAATAAGAAGAFSSALTFGGAFSLAAAGWAGWSLGTAFNNWLESRDVVMGRGAEEKIRAFMRPATQWKYVVSLEQTDFVNKNVKEFSIGLATGKLFEKASFFSSEKRGKVIDENYSESMASPKSSPPSQIIEVQGAGGYKNDGIFGPEKILVRIIFNDGKSISLYSDAMVNAQEGKRGCTVKESDILARYNKKYSQSAQGTGQQAEQTFSDQQAKQKTYTATEGKSVALKSYIFDIATKLGIAGGYTAADVAIGSWDKKTDDLMIKVVNSTFQKVLGPDVVKKISGQLGEGKIWKWSNIAPQIGYSPDLSGAIKYFQDASVKVTAANS